MIKDLPPPEKLAECNPAVKKLYTMGDIQLDRPMVAIIGSRRGSSLGMSTAYSLAADLASKGITIISGLAIGIDSQAHRGALSAKGITLAVLPSGLKNIYPARHHQLAHTMVNQQGGLISEHKNKYRPKKYDFLLRNRIISALSDVVIVVEAALRSGALNTARQALDIGRDVMAVPGALNNPYSAGTNNLIKQGAQVVTDYRDVLLQLGLEDQSEELNLQAYSPLEKELLQLLRLGPMTVEELIAKLGQTPQRVNQVIGQLEINSVVSRLPGNYLKIR